MFSDTIFLTKRGDTLIKVTLTNEILKRIENGVIDIDNASEDIHSFIESTLTYYIGDEGKKLHTGRSRNDQVALDMKLYVRDEIDAIDQEVKALLEALQKIMEENVHTYMPGFTNCNFK